MIFCWGWHETPFFSIGGWITLHKTVGFVRCCDDYSNVSVRPRQTCFFPPFDTRSRTSFLFRFPLVHRRSHHRIVFGGICWLFFTCFVPRDPASPLHHNPPFKLADPAQRPSSSSSTMAVVSRGPSPPPGSADCSTPCAENWCYTHVSFTVKQMGENEVWNIGCGCSDSS